MDSLECLRRMIIDQKPARLDFQTGISRHSLFYKRPGFAGSHQQVTEGIRQLFPADIASLAHINDDEATASQHVFAPQAIATALAGYAIDERLRTLLLQFAGQLPPLSVKLYPMQRYAFQDNAAYIKMHQQYQRDGILDMHNYISEADSPAEESIRLRVMMATYTLGLVAPVASPSFKRLRRVVKHIKMRDGS